MDVGEKSEPVEAKRKSSVESHHRETWSGRFDFFLSALGYAGKFIRKKIFNILI